MNRAIAARSAKLLRILWPTILAVAVAAPASAPAAPGDLNESFGGDGVTFLKQFDGGNEYPLDLVVGADGRTVAAGSTTGIGEDFFPTAAVGALTPDGAADSGFGTKGRVGIDFGAGDSPVGGSGVGVAVLPDGRIVVAGAEGFPLARLNPDGSPDTSFDGDGLRTAPPPGVVGSQATAMALAADGRIVVGGYSGPQADRDLTFVRVLADGGLDPTFSDDGVATLDVGPIDLLEDLALDGSGAIVAAGISSVGQGVVVRLRPDGSPDPAFAGDGVAEAVDADLRALALDPGGRVIAAGSSGKRFVAIRFDASGAIDAGFGSAGISEVRFGRAAASLHSLVADTDGGVVLGGTATRTAPDWSDSDIALARLGPDGALDRGFSGDGRATADLRCERFEGAFALGRTPAGDLVAGGGCAYEIVRNEHYSSVFTFAGFEGDAGPADADGDGVVDSRDRCPSAAGPRRGRGCGSTERDFIRVRRERGRLVGEIESVDADCELAEKVLLKRTGGDVVARTKTRGARFRLALPERGSAYAVAPARRDRDGGICSLARSKPLG